MKDKIFRNGFNDGSGKGYIIKIDDKGEEHFFLATHWGCGCCDRETTQEDIELADRIVELLNKHGIVGGKK